MPSSSCRVLAAALLALGLSGVASAHRERPLTSPPRPGAVPDLDRKPGRTLVVCKASSRPTAAALADIKALLKDATGEAKDPIKAELAAWKRNTKLFKQCRYEHIQTAVNDATDGTTILVLPGVYREEPSRAAPSHGAPDLPDGSYSFEYHLANPNDANLIAILGKQDITLEGTGLDPRDVLIDAGFVKDVPIRADKADGVIIRNLWARDGNEHCIYVVETSGYAFDRTVGSYCSEYELFSYASDHGLFTDCEAEGGGDSGIYTGGAPDTSELDRFSAEIRRCKMHTNALGFSGTQGNSVWMHDNDIYDNAVGISFNTQNDHPEPPQRQSLIENNLIHDNNLDIYAPTTPTPAGGPAYGLLRYPVGSAMWIVGGQDNVIRNNWVYGNQRFGIMIFGNAFEAPILAETHRNDVYGNVFGVRPDLTPAPNATVDQPGTTGFVEGPSDVFWGGSGNDNCFGPQDGRSGTVKFGPPAIAGFQPCPYPNTGAGGAVPRLEVAELLLSCILEPDPMNPGRFVTTDDFYPCPWGHENLAPYANKNELECGNGTVDLGEECDAGYGGGPSATETCASLGRGAGQLGCNGFCDFDTSACASSACGVFLSGNVSVKKAGAAVTIRLIGMDVAGRTFDPSTEGVDVTLRTTALVDRANAPAGDGWTSRLAGQWKFKDTGEVRSMDVRRSAGRVSMKLDGVDAGAVQTADVVGVTVRIGDDCWSGELSCAGPRSGKTRTCTRTNRR